MGEAARDVKPFEVAVPQAAIDDLRRRIDQARWPDRETVRDWSQGVPENALRALVSHWRHGHDWRACERWINAQGSFVTTIDGLDIHFLHIRSPEPDATPLLLTHGWPGAILEFRDAVPGLVDPVCNGGEPEDAFHLVIPSLPGFGFSGKPDAPGWGTRRIADAWTELMHRLGYETWLAQGGDWGAAVTTELGVRQTLGLAGIHVNLPLVLPAQPEPPFLPDEQAMLDAMGRYIADEAAYAQQQATRPQTLGYGLADSPIGQAAWIYEKFSSWAECDGAAESALSRSAMLDVISLYWFTNSGASSARLYWESFRDGFGARTIPIPAGCSIFPSELYRAPRRWAERVMPNLVWWSEPAHGGHFAAMEQPALFVQEMRGFARAVRSA